MSGTILIERLRDGRVVSTSVADDAPTRVRVPAMPPVQRWFVDNVRTVDLLLIPKTSPDAHRAYCYAQALADRDGRRRRVVKGGDGWWHIQPARAGREALP